MTLPAWWDKEKQKQNKRSRAQELKRAKKVGGSVTAGSGSSWRAPQDVKGPTHLEQLKYTDKGSFSIKVEEWKKIKADALQSGREPRLIVDFVQHGIRLVVEEGEIE